MHTSKDDIVGKRKKYEPSLLRTVKNMIK
jgi:hypothetical protein